MNLEDLLTTEQVAAMLGLRPNTLEIQRHKGRHTIPFIKFGTARCGTVRYQRADVEAWLAERKRTSTSDKGEVK